MARRKSSAPSWKVILGTTLLIIIGIGLVVVSKHHKSPMAAYKTVSQNLVQSSTQKGYTSYCDSTTKLCFEYPADWKLHESKTASIGDSLVAINPTTSLDASYSNILPTIGDPKVVFTSDPLATSAPPAAATISIAGLANFQVLSLQPIYNTDYVTIGGYYGGGKENIPAYITTSKANVTALGLKVNQQAKLPGTAFNIHNQYAPNNILLFGTGPITDQPFTAEQAAAWLTSSDGLLAAKIAVSLHNQQPH